MARYKEAVCRICRREGGKLFLKGQRCFTNKCAVERKNYPPGQGGDSRFRRRRRSDYGIQLREKQKARSVYGVMERQFRRYVEMADRSAGVTGEMLLQILERRLDNVVYRSGLAPSRADARQLVVHGHFTANDKRMNVPSYLVKAGDVLKVKDRSKVAGPFKDLGKGAGLPVPDWLTVDLANLTITVVSLPTREQVEAQFEEQQIVEFYSR